MACGDFKQLPPVPNYNLQDDGSYCFESTIFQATFPHHLNLRQVSIVQYLREKKIRSLFTFF